ncbi:MAG: hypothetical protein AB1758_23445 [Candidatus Eremiobacterota bacterium]
MALSRKGIQARNRPAHEVVRDLWNDYLSFEGFDELDRIESIQGQRGPRALSAVEPRRLALSDALAQLPTGRWVEVDEFFRYVRATGNDFVVSYEPLRLYVGGSRQYGHLGYDDGGNLWTILQGRFTLAFLMEYAATLGVVDLACRDAGGARQDHHHLWGCFDDRFSRYDGLMYIRVTRLGEFLLGRQPDYRPADPATRGGSRLRIDGDLRIRFEGAPCARSTLLLDQIAESDGSGWKLTPRSLARAAHQLPLADIQTFLHARAVEDRPGSVESLLQQARQRFRAIRDHGAARVLEVDSPNTMERLFRNPVVRKRCLRAGNYLLIPESALARVLEALVELGYPVGAPVGADTLAERGEALAFAQLEAALAQE